MKSYLEKHAFCPPQISEQAHPELGIIVVIPCFNEPDLVSSLESLWNCARPKKITEVIIVINSSENAPEDVISQNNKSFAEAVEWIEAHRDKALNFFLVRNYSLPQKHAGVGLARKIGMDEAVERFRKVGNKKGVIVCFDADSTCDKNYLIEIDEHFRIHATSPACSIYFEHPLDLKNCKALGNHDYSDLQLIREGIVQYELFLRYYRQGLKFAGHPNAYHTIGSGMAVRADVYCEQGGMNKRKAGEDFYFLQKIIPLGNFTEINSTRVIPSPRPSQRVPFGTGRAISDFLKNETRIITAYPPQIFIDLKKFFELVPYVYNSANFSGVLKDVPGSVSAFLDLINFEQQFCEIKKNSSALPMFLKRFFRWFDGFTSLKFAHFARDNFYGEMAVAEAARGLLELKNDMSFDDTWDIKELLDLYRRIDRNSL